MEKLKEEETITMDRNSDLRLNDSNLSRQKELYFKYQEKT